jgi:hypothetical protein
MRNLLVSLGTKTNAGTLGARLSPNEAAVKSLENHGKEPTGKRCGRVIVPIWHWECPGRNPMSIARPSPDLV